MINISETVSPVNGRQFLFLPKSIGNLVSLEKFWLQDNQLTSLPEGLGNLRNLKELNIFNNPLKSLPESLSNLKNLQILGINWKDKKQHRSLPKNLKPWVETLKAKGCKVQI